MNDQIMMERIRDLLPTKLFGDSKDWREGNTVERVEWLLSMYASSKEEVARLERLVDDIEDDLARERQTGLE